MDEFFLVGHKISYSLSPKIYNEFFEKNRIDAHYGIFDVSPENFDSEIKIFLANENLKGFNITKPYKIRIIPHLNILSSEAEELGSVNCAVRFGNLFKGFNTDKTGFIRSIEKFGSEIKGKSALVLGAGGVAPAVVSGLSEIGASKIFIANRTFEKAKKLAERFERAKEIPVSEIPEVAPECKIIVNATTVGLHGEKSLVPESAVRSGQILYDLIYNPEETDFLKTGKKKGAIVMNGRKMLEEQAKENLRIWGFLK